VSVGQLDEGGCKINIDEGVMTIREPSWRLLAKVARSANRLYVLNINLTRPVCLAARGKEETWRWHARLEHVNMSALRKMAREELVRGLPAVEQVDQLCEACLAGKQRRSSFPEKIEYRARRVLELVHGDLCSPITPTTLSRNSYFLLLVDDKSRYMCVAPLPSKDRAALAIKEIKAQAEGESGLKLGAIWTDRGGEFNSIEFGQFCAAEGVGHQCTAPYNPQQNDIVEYRNGTVVAMACSMLKAKKLSGWFWGEAINTVVYILNRCLMKGVEGMTLFEAWHGKKSAVHHLKTFGRIVYVRNTKPHLQKLEDRGRKMIFVGYEHDTKAFRAYDPETRRVHVSRDVVFDDEAQWSWDDGEEMSATSDGDDTFTIEYTMPPGDVEHDDALEDPGMPAMPPVSTSARQAGTEVETPDDIQFVSPPQDADGLLDADRDEDAPLRFRPLEGVIGPGTTPGPLSVLSVWGVAFCEC
jgi:transposase InsO family protein